MTVALTMAALVAIYAAASFYLRKAKQYLEASDAPWDRLYHAAEKVIADPTMPQGMANFSAAAVICSGCGCLTRSVLLDAFLCKIGLRKRANGREPDLTPEQQAMFNDVVVNAIYYDSLRAPFSGFLMRRLVFPWLRAASVGDAPARKSTVRRMATSTRAAISHRAEGRRLLEATS